MRRVILYFSYLHEGDWQKIFNSIKEKQEVDFSRLDLVKDEINSEYITIIDENYPDCLKQISNPPFVIYYKGDISLIDNEFIKLGAIGSRNSSSYGEKMNQKIISDLKTKNVVIVSGLAKGNDSLAHQNSIDNNLKTIAVLGSGVNYCYPSENKNIYDLIIKNNGLIISEYPNLTKPTKDKFPIRNRLIAAFSDGLIVVEANKKSGTMITVSQALEQGKNIYCVPTDATKNSGCNELIKQGAKLIENGKDILEDYEYQYKLNIKVD